MEGKTTVSSSGTSRRRSIGLGNVSRRGGLSTAPRNLIGCDGLRPDVVLPVAARVTGPASSPPLEPVGDALARQRPGELLLALPRGGAVDHRAGDVARGVAGRSLAGRRLLDLWREPDPALLRQHHLSLAGAPAARGGYSQAPRSCGDFRTDRGHLYAGVPGDAAGRGGMGPLGARCGSGASRGGAQAPLPTSSWLVR